MKDAKAVIDDHKEQYKAYGDRYGVKGLDGRLLREIDPAGMLAIKDTREIIMDGAEPAVRRAYPGAELDRESQYVEDLRGFMDGLIDLTNKLHVGAVWSKADDLKKADTTDVRMWLLMAYACKEAKDKDYTADEYVADFDRVKKVLSETPIKDAVAEMHSRAGSYFSVESYKGKDVPFSDKDAFLYMAIAGHKFGVVQAGDIYFVGADELDFGAFADEHGLSAVDKEDRGRMATFYQKNGKDVVKKLYPGLAIVFGGKDMAMELALKHK